MSVQEVVERTHRAAPKRKAPKKQAKRAPAKKQVVADGMSEKWRAILREVAKAGPKGMARADMRKVATKHGAKFWIMRFVEAGSLRKVRRGVYAVTTKGRGRAK